MKIKYYLGENEMVFVTGGRLFYTFPQRKRKNKKKKSNKKMQVYTKFVRKKVMTIKASEAITITHARHGLGKIVDINGQTMTIEFKDSDGTCFTKSFDISTSITGGFFTISDKDRKKLLDYISSIPKDQTTSNQQNLSGKKVSLSSDDEKAKKVFENTGLKIGDKIKNLRIYEVINKYFKQTLKGWVRNRWIIPWFNKAIAWLPYLDGKTRDGWRNIDKVDEIIEDMTTLPSPKTYDGIPVRKYAKAHPYRIVLERQPGTYNYIVRGVYKFDEQKSVNDERHYYKKI